MEHTQDWQTVWEFICYHTYPVCKTWGLQFIDVKRLSTKGQAHSHLLLPQQKVPRKLLWAAVPLQAVWHPWGSEPASWVREGGGTRAFLHRNTLGRGEKKKVDERVSEKGMALSVSSQWVRCCWGAQGSPTGALGTRCWDVGGPIQASLPLRKGILGKGPWQQKAGGGGCKKTPHSPGQSFFLLFGSGAQSTQNLSCHANPAAAPACLRPQYCCHLQGCRAATVKAGRGDTRGYREGPQELGEHNSEGGEEINV